VSTATLGATETKKRVGLWETAMMVRSGGSGGGPLAALPIFLMVIGAGLVGIVLVTLAERHDKRPESPQLAFSVCVAMLFASMGMVAYTLRRTRAAAFLHTLPPLHEPRALLMLPMFALGLALSFLALPFFPPLVALAYLGWWCFAATVGYRFAGRGGLFLFLVTLPSSFLGPAASALAYSTWQWPGAALTSLLLAAVGYVTSPRDRARDITLKNLGAETRSSEPSRASVVVPRPSLRGALGATLRAFNHCAFFGTAIRIPGVFSLFVVALYAIFGFIAWARPIEGFTNYAVLFNTTVPPATWLAGACEPTRLEFLASRPLHMWQRRWASSHAFIWGILLLSALAPIRVMVSTTVNGDDLRKLPYPAATVDAAAGAGAPAPVSKPSSASPSRSDRRYPRHVPVSPTLRSLLLRFIGIVALLHWGAFSGYAALWVGRARKSRRSHLWIAGSVAFVALILAAFASFGPKDGALAPIWLAALLAAVGTFELRRSLRLPLRR
jgi:hypothetical protein